jgi:hypothetical protein
MKPTASARANATIAGRYVAAGRRRKRSAR